MRLIYTALFCTLILTANAQGLEETFDAACQCWKVTNHYDDGQLSSVHYENKERKRDGEAKTYDASGNLVRKENWRNGKLDGKSYHYHADGSIYFTSVHDMGQKVGTWVFKDTEGTPIQEISYSGNGEDGVYTYYHAGVKYLEQTISNGKLSETNVLNQEVYDIAKEEAESTGKKPQ